MQSKVTVKFISSSCFLLIAYGLLLLHNSPASGYESSIYSETPWLVWVILFISLLSGIGIIVHQIYTKKTQNNLWIVGLILVVMSNIIVLSLHIIRGYALWGGSGDPGVHLGIIKDLLNSGHLTKDNFYPIVHIYSSQFSLLLDVSPIVILKDLPLIYYLIYISFIYFIARFLLPNKEQIILATVAGTALINGWYINLTPACLSNLAFPLALYLLLQIGQSTSSSWKTLFVIIIFFYTVFHPVPSFVLLIILITMCLSTGKILGYLQIKSLFVPRKYNYDTTVLLLVLFIAWMSSFYVFTVTIENLNNLITESGPTQITSLQNNLEYAQNAGYNVVSYFFKLYSSIVLFFILTLGAFPFLWKNRTTDTKIIGIISLYPPLISMSFFLLLFYFLNLNFSPLRLLVYFIVLCTIPVGFILSKFLIWASSRTKVRQIIVAYIIVSILLFFVSINGISYVYSSSYTVSISQQTTQNEIEGMNWFFHSKNTTLNPSSWYFAPQIYADYLLTSNERAQRNDLTPYRVADFPNHFGYDNNTLIGKFYKKDHYLITREALIKIYTDVYKLSAKKRLLPSDFIKLENDSSLDKIYSSKGLEIWYIHSMYRSTDNNLVLQEPVDKY